jgi:tRNA pseudouridine32 synthase/23S rRNA pseudouridine746 synthase
MEILFQDQRFLVVNKAAGLPVHAGRAGGPSVEDYFDAWRGKAKAGPWLAHRLDRDTAGCLVIALKKSALIAAQKCFAEGLVEKKYWAVVRGVPDRESGVIDLPLGKIVSGRSWKMGAEKSAPPAVTEWRVMGANGNKALVEFRPKTGRTHQVRAHAAWMGHPIFGDPPHMHEAVMACGYVENVLPRHLRPQ